MTRVKSKRLPRLSGPVTIISYETPSAFFRSDRRTARFRVYPIMHSEQLREFLLTLPHVTEEEPFGPEVVVYKVMGKMFALVDYDSVPPTMNLKCDPDRALDLRDVHEAIRPGYHMNKRHWNTLDLNGTLRSALVAELIRHSYDLVVAGLPRRIRESLP